MWAKRQATRREQIVEENISKVTNSRVSKSSFSMVIGLGLIIGLGFFFRD